MLTIPTRRLAPLRTPALAVVSYVVGAALVAWPALAGQVALSTDELGRIALVVLAAQLFVGLGRVGGILASENADSSRHITWIQVSVLAVLACAPSFVTGPDLQTLVLLPAALFVGALELRRLRHPSTTRGLVAGMAWLTIATLVLLLCDVLGLGPSVPVLVAAWAVPGIALLARPGAASATMGVSRGSLGVPWSQFGQSVGDFVLGAAGVAITVFVVGRGGALGDLGTLRGAQNFAIPVTVSVAALMFVCSSPSLFSSRRLAVAAGLIGPVLFGCFNIVLIALVGMTGAANDAVVESGYFVVLAVTAGALSIPSVVHLRRTGRLDVVVRGRSVGLGLFITLLIVFRAAGADATVNGVLAMQAIASSMAAGWLAVAAVRAQPVRVTEGAA